MVQILWGTLYRLVWERRKVNPSPTSNEGLDWLLTEKDTQPLVGKNEAQVEPGRHLSTGTSTRDSFGLSRVGGMPYLAVENESLAKG